MNFNITRIRPKGFQHTLAFVEVMDSLGWALSALGHTATVTDNWIDANSRNIIFGAEHLAVNQPSKLPAGTIIYNLEQPSHPSLVKVRAIAQGSRLMVWDYSSRNVQDWKDAGVDVRHVPIGYTPNLTRIKSTPPDIDVLFYGWMTPRRQKVIDYLKSAGINVVVANCYGGGRDQLISRSKIILNVHHDGRDRFEIVRCSYPMANYKVVISETSVDDDEYSDLDTGIIRCSYEDIVPTVQNTLKKIPHGFFAMAAISNRDYVKTVEKALSELSPMEKVAARYEQGSPDIGHYMPWLRDHAKGTILEIGVRDGASTAAFLSGLQVNGGVLLSVDIADCGSLFAGHPQWKFIQSSSQNPKLKVPEIDILFIDGDHTREAFVADLTRFYPIVKPGGLIICHDIAPEPGQTLEDVPGSDYPSKAIREEYFNFCEKYGLSHKEIEGKYGLGVMTRGNGTPLWTHSQLREAINETRTDSDESWEASAAVLNAQA